MKGKYDRIRRREREGERNGNTVRKIGKERNMYMKGNFFEENEGKNINTIRKRRKKEKSWEKREKEVIK